MLGKLRVGLLASLLLAPVAVEAEDALPLAEDVTPSAAQVKRKKPAKDKAIEVSAIVQVRGVAGPADSDPEADADTPEHGIRSVEVPRARLQVGARVAGWKARLKVGFDKGEARMLNGYVERDLGAGLALRAGQFKRIASLGYLVDAENLQTLDRPDLLDEVNVASRDIGLLVGGDWLEHRLEATVAAYNGNGPNLKNDNPDLRTEARVDVAPLGRYELTSRTLERNLRVRLGVGGARWRDNALRRQAEVLQTEFDQTWLASGFAAVRGAGVELRSEGFLAVTSAVDARPEASQAEPLGIADRRAVGGSVQLAVDVPWIPPLQAHAVLAYWVPDRDARRDRQQDWTAGFTWYVDEDRLKLTAAFDARRTELGDGRHVQRLRGSLQVQAAF